MAKKEKMQKAANCRKATPAPTSACLPTTTSGVRDDTDLGYKVRALFDDLKNMRKDTTSEQRLNSTTDEHYISAPYFQPDQAAAVKAALVDIDIGDHMDPTGDSYTSGYVVQEETEETKEESNSSLSARLLNQPLDTAIHTIMANFLEKRKASGDARPCSPHNLAPVYAALFGIQLAELQDENIVSRLRRSGI